MVYRPPLRPHPASHRAPSWHRCCRCRDNSARGATTTRIPPGGHRVAISLVAREFPGEWLVRIVPAQSPCASRAGSWFPPRRLAERQPRGMAADPGRAGGSGRKRNAANSQPTRPPPTQRSNQAYTPDLCYATWAGWPCEVSCKAHRAVFCLRLRLPKCNAIVSNVKTSIHHPYLVANTSPLPDSQYISNVLAYLLCFY